MSKVIVRRNQLDSENQDSNIANSCQHGCFIFVFVLTILEPQIVLRNDLDNARNLLG